MNATMRTAIEAAALKMLQHRVEVQHGSVAAALAHEIVNAHISDLVPDDAIEAGVQAAIEEIDEATFAFAVDVIRDRVAAEVEGQAKAIALGMLRNTASKAERAAAMTAE